MMTAHDVVVVGGGLGGLTVAALLAARGVDVCLLERQSFVGGCATPIQKLDYTFDPTFALDSLWEPGQLHQRIFAELPASPPETKVLSPSYAVRLPDATNVIVAPDEQQFLHAIANFFPECASAALSFYQRAAELSDALSHAAERFPHLASLSRLEKARLLIAEPRLSRASATYLTKAVASDLNAIGHRFKCFIDSQLLSFAGVPSERCSWGRAALTLTIARRSAYAVKGGGAAGLSNALLESIHLSGGSVRLNATALRLAYTSSGVPKGVTLLSGESVAAKRAIVSNLTIWDTYGKLIGPERTPSEVRARLKSLRGWGRYSIHLGLRQDAASSLVADHFIGALKCDEPGVSSTEESLFMLSVAPAWDSRAPKGQRAATISKLVNVDQWFAFHDDESQHERQDDETLEAWWGCLSRAFPEELSASEIIETSTPLTLYESTRRKLGMAGAPSFVTSSSLGRDFASFTHRTSLRNLFMVGDTVFPGQGAAAVSHSALIVANEITKSPRRSKG